MDDIDSLGGLRGLYQDLSAISDSPMVNVERLCLELEMHIEDFRKLLTKASKNDTSRKSVLSGECPGSLPNARFNPRPQFAWFANICGLQGN